MPIIIKMEVGMFSPKAAFLRLNGQEFTYEELRRKLREIRAENIQDLPVEFGVQELLGAAESNDWIRPTERGLLRIVVLDGSDSTTDQSVAA
jgi:hypothetical protein